MDGDSKVPESLWDGEEEEQNNNACVDDSLLLHTATDSNVVHASHKEGWAHGRAMHHHDDSHTATVTNNNSNGKYENVNTLHSSPIHINKRECVESLIRAVQCHDGDLGDVIRTFTHEGVASAVHGSDSQGMTVLHHAVRRGHVPTVVMLVTSYGADMECRDGVKGMTCLMHAAEVGCPTMVSALLALHCKVNTRDHTRRSALMIASECGNMDAVARLLYAGGGVGGRESTHGMTALMLALSRGHVEIAHLLIKHGIQLYTHDARRKSVLMYASERQACHAILSQILQGCGSTTDVSQLVNARDAMGYSALMYAAEHGNREAVLELIKYGALHDGIVEHGTQHTALTKAIINRHTSTTLALLAFFPQQQEDMMAVMYEAKQYGAVDLTRALGVAGITDPGDAFFCDAIRTITVKGSAQGNDVEEDEETHHEQLQCTICSRNKMTAAVQPCGHLFCKSCLRKHREHCNLNKQPVTCMMCRHVVTGYLKVHI